MKKNLPAQIPRFKNDAEIAAFMEEHSAFELLDADLAEIVPVASLGHSVSIGKSLLKNKRVEVAFRDERAMRKIFPASRIFRVINSDTTGILLSASNSSSAENFYVPYLNVRVIRVLTRPSKRSSVHNGKKNKTSSAKARLLTQR